MNGGDPIAAAHAALEEGQQAGQVARRFTQPAWDAGRIGELIATMIPFHSDTGTLRVLNELARLNLNERRQLFTNAPSANGQKERVRGIPRSLADLARDPELLKPPQYDLRPYTARGRAILLSVPPKIGKSTFAGHYAAAKAKGAAFLGTPLQQGKVLWVGPDEALGDQVRRLYELGAPADELYIWDGRAPTIQDIARAVTELEVALVVVDTLPRIAGIRDENDNGAWNAWWDEALPLIHNSAAVWLFIHHDRKSGGKDGEGIRGASAIFGSVDIAFSLQRVDGHKRRRVLRMEGTRFENVEDVVIELQLDGRYTRLGAADTVRAEEDPDLAKLKAILTSEPATVADITEKVTLSYDVGDAPVRTTVGRRLDRMVDLGWVSREGVGGPSNPHRYALCACADPRVRTTAQAQNPHKHSTFPATAPGPDVGVCTSPTGAKRHTLGVVAEYASQSRKGLTHTVSLLANGELDCTCEDFVFRSHKNCKHIRWYLSGGGPRDTEPVDAAAGADVQNALGPSELDRDGRLRAFGPGWAT